MVLALAAPACADFDAEAFPPYERCALCHGLFGVSASARFPNLAGQEPVYIENQVRAFLSGDRHNDGGQMSSIVTELKPEEIAVVVEWFATQDPPAPAPEGDAKGRALYEARNCGDCHDAETSYLGVPHLTAQHADYLAKQMQDFRDGTRGTHLGCLPHGPMMPDDDSEIAAIAAYLASVPRP
ncbi:c-type cytochrome [Mameliella sp.]|uniref:c-type cytochrome n=1 Tax=Mameliella sp. TaxID=1924940 RepID=UPI003B50B5A6